jgi:hypothetical protein
MYKNIPESEQETFHKKVLATKQYKYTCPTTAEEYWQVIDNNWTDLLNIILMFGPENVIDTSADCIIEKLAVVATKYKDSRDIRLIDLFNKTWASAPDDGRIHLIPAWHILCDLCSESYLVFDSPTC